MNFGCRIALNVYALILFFCLSANALAIDLPPVAYII